MPLGIMLNELLTNSLKYASGLQQRLAIDIRLTPCADGYCLRYSDNGPGFPQGVLQDREGGLGAYLLRSMSRQLNFAPAPDRFPVGITRRAVRADAPELCGKCTAREPVGWADGVHPGTSCSTEPGAAAGGVGSVGGGG